MTNERPIIFNTEMVRAILRGEKTQTRRVVKPQPPEDGEWATKCPYLPGQILWVRETWRCIKYDSMDGNLSYGVKFKDGEQEHFEFDDNERFHQFGKYAFKNGWQSPYYMPRAAARLFLLVKNVWAERLQDITPKSIAAEGLPSFIVHPEHEHYKNVCGNNWLGFEWFHELWNSLNKKRGYGWSANPWVWVVEFERKAGEKGGQR